MPRGQAGTGTPTHVLPHVRISFGGTIGTPHAEIWECTINYAGATDSLMADIVAYPADLWAQELPLLAASIKKWFQSADFTNNGQGASSIPYWVFLDYVKLNLVNNLNRYVNPPNTLQFAEVAGGHIAPQGTPLPWQGTTAITLRSGNRRTGRGSKGRIFPPLAGETPQASPYMRDTTTAAMTHAFSTLLSDINTGLFTTAGFVHAAADPGVGNCVIVSPTPATGPNAGAAPMNSVITKVEVDQVPDVMTSRVDRIPRKFTAPLEVPNLTNVGA